MSKKSDIEYLIKDGVSTPTVRSVPRCHNFDPLQKVTFLQCMHRIEAEAPVGERPLLMGTSIQLHCYPNYSLFDWKLQQDWVLRNDTTWKTLKLANITGMHVVKRTLCLYLE
jgi:hypothetical protein